MFKFRFFGFGALALFLMLSISACLLNSNSPGSGGGPNPFNGGSVNPDWFFVDGGSVNNTPMGAMPNAVVFNSKVYAIWTEGGGQPENLHVNVGVYGGATASSSPWTVLGGPNGINKNPSAQAADGQLVVFNSKLYATWFEDDAEPQIRAAVYNGNDSSPEWTFIDGNGPLGMNYNVDNAAMYSKFIVFNSKLYMTWTEGNFNYQILVAVYNGNDGSPSWSFVDGDSPTGLNYSSQGATSPQFGVLNSKLYVAWSESLTSNGNAGDVIHVRVYSGNDSSPAWAFVDGDSASGLNLNGANFAVQPNMVTFNNKLYMGWTELTDGTSGTFVLHVKVYNGNDVSPSWILIDGGPSGLNVNPNAGAAGINFLVVGSQLYATWMEATGTQYSYWVKVYDGNDSLPQWNFLDGIQMPINCVGYVEGTGPSLLSFEDNLYAISSDECPGIGASHGVVRFEEHVSSQ